MANTTNVRVGGSAFTYFTWGTKVIGFARQVSHTSPEPVGPGPVAIQPLDARRPVQVVTPAAAGMGTVTVELFELYNRRVWEQLEAFTGANDIVDIFQQMAAKPNPIDMMKIIDPPTLAGDNGKPYAEVFHNCVITNVGDNETIEIGTMDIRKEITIAYTYKSIDRAYSANPNIANQQGGDAYPF